MSIAAPQFSLVKTIRGTVGVFVTLAGATCGLTLLYLGMRSVMEIGGACAEGGPFVPVRPCPKGVPGMMIGGIWGGIIFFGLYVWQTSRYKVPSLILLSWSALFLSLGWNFLEFGLDPPGPSGLEWGWLVCAIVFGLMGGLPLLVVADPVIKGFTRPAAEDSSPMIDLKARLAGTIGRPGGPKPSSSPGAPSAMVETPASPAEAVALLERLEAMHRTGALSDAEFGAAKRRVIEGA